MKTTYVLTIIGAGSTYTPELMDGIIQHRDSLHLAEIRLMDIDARKLAVVGGLCRRMADAAGLPAVVTLTEALDEALAGADFVVTQIRVGRLASRILDETIPPKHGLIGQETTGIGGFFKALRTIPVMLDIAKRMEVLCPGAFLINFTNPSGIVTQALLDHSSVRAIGLCNVPVNMVADIARNMGFSSIEAEYVGLNHLSWITKILHDGTDHLPRAIQEGINAAPMKNIKASGFSKECLRAVGAIPSSYLEYFYNRNQKLQEEQAEERCRGEICSELEAELLELYANSALHVKPQQLEGRGGSKYSLAAISLIDAIACDRQEVHIVDVANRGALPFMAGGDVVEIACRVGADGAQPMPLPSFGNGHIIGMMQLLKRFEHHTVAAAIRGDEDEAMRALMLHPLVADFAAAQACFAEMKEAHRAYLPLFFGGEATAG